MPRLLLAAVPLLAGLAPLTAAALGLGEINLRSGLNQPFRAEIPVRGDTPDELAQLQVRLAGPETFQRFGLDRPAFLGGFSFQVEARGTAGVVRITSAQPVTEPFVSLLLEASWPQGRLLREYTVLLDPPAFLQESPAPAGQARTPAVPVAPAEPLIQRSAGTTPSAVPSAAPSITATAVAPPDGSDYLVRQNDTLWAIASQLRPGADVSINQMMVALFRANPEAFAGNINVVRAGAVLRVPGLQEITAISGREAAADVGRQNQEWRLARGEDAPRLQLVPPGETGPAGRPAQPVAGDQAARLQADLEESRRLLAVRDSQLKALQDQLAEVQGGARPVPPPAAVPPPAETAVERLPGEPLPEADVVTAPAAVAAPPRVAREPAPRPARDVPVAPARSWSETLGAVVFNIWFLVSAAVVLLAGLFFVFARRRMLAEESPGQFAEDLRERLAPAPEALSRDDDFIVEESPAERSMASGVGRAAPLVRPGPDGETALERTISTEGGVEVDQADVLAEADFHMAYGLYDQAAALLTRSLRDNPGRRDLRLKLLEVLFIWENKGTFLKEAQAFYDQLTDKRDPDWNKVLIMGKQLCPAETLFATAPAAAVTGGLDLNLGDEGGSAVDVDFAEGVGEGVDLDLTGARQGPAADSLDFDLGELGDDEATRLVQTDIAFGRAGAGDGPTEVARRPESPTMETPTIESADLGARTMETPTIEAPAVGHGSRETPTMETPTIEARTSRTMETPTIESPPPGIPGSVRSGQGPEQTEEINLEDLGLDLTGLDSAAGDLGTGTHDVLGTTGALEAGSFNLGDAGDDTGTAPRGGADSTAEMRGLGLDEGTLDLPAFSTAIEKSGRLTAGDTAEHPAVDDTAEQPRAPVSRRAPAGPGGSEDEAVDFLLDEQPLAAVEETALTQTARRGPEGPTMTEVGTKLDLARAYVDMGDPDGARSILNEVLEEGDTAQRQQARQLLDDLAD